MIHGAGDSGAVWNLVRDAVEAREVAWDAPDLIDIVEPVSGETVSVADYASAVIDYADASEQDEIVLAGHSMGSLIALEVASRRPAWMSRLVLMCTGYPMAVNAALIEQAERDPRSAAALITKWSHTRGFAATDPNAMTHHEALTAHVPAAVLASDLRACDSYSEAEDAARSVEVPTLVITATEDKMVPSNLAEPILTALADASHLSLEGVGHRIQWEAPERVAAALVGVASE